MGFPEMIRTLESYGVSDVLLPFILIFTVVFAVMQKTKLLGDGRKNYNVIIALVMALAVVIPHTLNRYPRNGDVVEIINKFLPNVSMLLIVILMVMIMLGLFGVNFNLAGKTMGGWFTLLSIILVVIIFGNAAGWAFFQWNWIARMDSDVKNLIVIILVFGIIITFITSEPRDAKKKNFFENIGDKFAEIIHK